MKLLCKLLGHDVVSRHDQGLDASWHECRRCGQGHWDDRLMCWEQCVPHNREDAWRRHLKRGGEPPKFGWFDTGRSYVRRYQLVPDEPMVDRLVRHDADCEDRRCEGCA